jgi:phosphate transport system permease protein
MTSKIAKDNSWFQRKRTYTDKSAGFFIGLGGISIIFAIVLIFFYLLWVVAPLLSAASVEPLNSFEAPLEGEVKYLALEESGHIAIQISTTGLLQFTNVDSGEPIASEQIELPEDEVVRFVDELDSEGRMVALTTASGYVQIVSFGFRVNFDQQGTRMLIPELNFPYGEEPVKLSGLEDIVQIAMIRDEERLLLAAVDRERQLLLQEYAVYEDESIGEAEYEAQLEASFPVEYIKFGQLGRWLYLASTDGKVAALEITDVEAPLQQELVQVIEPGRTLHNLRTLLGGISLIAADDTGKLVQWSLQRDGNNNYSLVRVRSFRGPAPFAEIVPERRRKGLLAVDQQGAVMLYHTTAENMAYNQKLIDFVPERVAISARANVALMQAGDGRYHAFKIHNEHPEVSWHALWEEVMYEGYDEPQYSWQSSSADNDFEPKFSLVPLTFGTIKAAFYAMMIAVPLAIMGAIYTAYFMSPKMRGLVKPSIEIMEALPTVILGFLAGLWFAPYVEEHLLAILSMLIVFPVGLILFAWGWTYLPGRIRHLVPDGWHAALLIPVIILLGYFTLALTPGVEDLVFDGNLQHWMRAEFGINYDQRNSVVVGVAMGIAVIPTIFSITEDAIFSVPRHLTNGSLALGATTWQTLTRVVILTASPGIFSAVMIGLGRAVGETMIVLMATGNTPVMDMSIFEGMRTLSANIAVELPESEVNSSHYRILFLAALVLFVVTFVFNTAAEVVRQRLRRRYGSL